MYVRTVVNGIAARNKTKRHDLARRKSYASEVNFKLITVGLSKRSIVMLMIALIPYVIHVSDSLLHMYSLSESFKTTQYMCRKSTLIARRVTLNHRVYDKNTRFTANLLTIAKRTAILGLTIITFLPLFLEMRTPCQICPIHDASSINLQKVLSEYSVHGSPTSLSTLDLIHTHIIATVITLKFLSAQRIAVSGDIHPNPGPSISLDSSLDTSASSSYAHIINSGLSIMHLNIQSIRNKLDILEIEAQPYDVLVFTESWLTHDISNDDLLIPNFNIPFRCDRVDRVGGGVIIYIRDTLVAKERTDLNVNNLEAIWVELHCNQRIILIGGIYRPPNANNTYWNLFEESIDRAFSQPCDNILVAGDFNINIQHSVSNKISRLIASYNAEQLINEPTHFTEQSSSLIDLMFIQNIHHVITSFVADPFIPDVIRFHCPIVTVLKFDKPKNNMYKRRIWLYDRANFDEYREILKNHNWNDLLATDDFRFLLELQYPTYLQTQPTKPFQTN